MLSGLRVAETLGKTKIDHIDVVLLFADTDKEVVWLDVSMKEMSRVDELDSLQLLIIPRISSLFTCLSTI